MAFIVNRGPARNQRISPAAPNGFTLNRLPRAYPVGSGPRVTGLPSPSVGTLLAQTRTVPVQPLAAYPYATPSVGASFGQSYVHAGGVFTMQNNNIADRH